ncbi:hypothetical protein [Neorhizobium tomejilense]|uniref:hypothetical protein n=1 Tax=Neorhizobium tomejilense TaxID=2093828 RepID=UPI00155E648E|nr:hypothetical protein [Neorhizobium tomejilense]
MTSDSLWMDCKACRKQVSVNAKSCPHCGAKRSRFRALKWIGGGFIGLVVVSAALAPDKSDRQAASVVGVKAASAPLPAKQTSFISAISDYSKRFNSASNELQQSALRDQRRGAILTALGTQLQADGWIGTLRKLETNGDGKAVVTVRLAPDLDILTWNNALSDVLHSTLIEKGTPLYAALMNMSVGDKVKVSGNFVRADADGIFENSITIDGAMTAPEFLFRFNNISKL